MVLKLAVVCSGLLTRGRLMNSFGKIVMFSALAGIGGLRAGAYIGADIMNRYHQSLGTLADRLVGRLSIEAMLLKSAKDEGLALDKSPTAQSLARAADQTTTTLGMLAGDFQLAESAPKAEKLLKELDANPLVVADSGSLYGKTAKVARDCLLSELAQAKPNYASCAARVGAAHNEAFPSLVSR